MGREFELDTLGRLFDRLEEGKGSIALVLGEAGLGKSRLLFELRNRATPRGFRWLEGRTLSFGDALPYWPLKEILEAESSIESGDGTEVRRAKLKRRVSKVGGRQDVDVQALEVLLGLSPGEAAGGGYGSRDRRGVETKAAGCPLRLLCSGRPKSTTIVVFEDVQWLDPSSEGVVEQLLAMVDHAPLLLCLAGRPDDGSAGLRILEHLKEARAEEFTEIHLTPLSGEQTRKMVRQFLGPVDMPRGFEKAIEAKTGGNPLFVQEVVRNLEETGSLNNPGTGTQGVDASGLAIPDTLQGVLSARVDRLPSQLKYDLRVASVIGRDFPPEMLATVGGRPTAGIADSLAQLEALGLVAPRAASAESEYAFNHALIQEAVYDSLPVRDRRRLHARVANVTESTLAERLDEFSGVLAYHYSRAEDWGKAQSFLMKAGSRCFQLAAGEEGRRQYREALDALLRAFDTKWQAPGTDDPVQWFIDQAEVIRALRSLGNLTDAVRGFYEKVERQYGPEDRRTIAAAGLLRLHAY